jgi:hypothetical protein
MGKVIDLRSRQPHMSGRAVCLACKHEWVAVAEIGTICLECPKCSLMKGAFVAMCVPDVALVCNCGNALFYMTHDGPMCGNCGFTHWDIVGAGC